MFTREQSTPVLLPFTTEIAICPNCHRDSLLRQFAMLPQQPTSLYWSYHPHHNQVWLEYWYLRTGTAQHHNKLSLIVIGQSPFLTVHLCSIPNALIVLLPAGATPERETSALPDMEPLYAPIQLYIPPLPTNKLTANR